MAPRTEEQLIDLSLEGNVAIYYSTKVATRKFDAYTFQLPDEPAPTTVRVPANFHRNDELQRVCFM